MIILKKLGILFAIFAATSLPATALSVALAPELPGEVVARFPLKTYTLPIAGSVKGSQGKPTLTINNQVVRVVLRGRFSTTRVLHPGRNSIIISATDDAGGVYRKTFLVTVLERDVIPPVITLIDMPVDVFDSTVTVKGRATDNRGVTRFQIGGQDHWVSADGQFAAPFKLPTYRKHYLSFEAWDAAGNHSRVETAIYRLATLSFGTPDTYHNIPEGFSVVDPRGVRLDNTGPFESPYRIIHNVTKFELVLVPAGEFMMGSADGGESGEGDERPRHRVFLDAYYIGVTEVSNRQFQRYQSGHNSGYFSGQSLNDDNQPVVNVRREDAMAFCDSMGLSLPTEAQWEKASRGIDGRIYPWGNTWDFRKANFSDRNDPSGPSDEVNSDSYALTAPVGSYPAGASPYGALDMAGNVWEWCADAYNASYYSHSPSRNPTGPSNGWLVARGGGWNASATNLRAANRVRGGRGDRHDNFGFRVALVLYTSHNAMADAHVPEDKVEDVPRPPVISNFRPPPDYSNFSAPQFTRRKLIYQPRLTYPEWAERDRVQASPRFHIIVSPDGRVSSVRLAVTSGYPDLDRLAEANVRRWLYEPGYGGNEAREATIKFMLNTQ